MATGNQPSPRVVDGDLGPEFERGTRVERKYTLKTDEKSVMRAADGTISAAQPVVNPQTGAIVFPASGAKPAVTYPGNRVTALRFDPNGNLVVEQQIGAPLTVAVPKPEQNAITGAALNANGNIVVSQKVGPPVLLPMPRLPAADRNEITGATFDPDGNMTLTQKHGNPVKVAVPHPERNQITDISMEDGYIYVNQKYGDPIEMELPGQEAEQYLSVFGRPVARQ